MKEEILFLTHKKNKEIENAIRSLRDSMGDRKLTIVSQSQPFDIEGTDLFLFDESIVQQMDFPTIGNSIIPGHAHFPVFAYIGNNKTNADYYWVIEYDVRFSGKWSVLFDHFTQFNADFLTSHIRYFHEEPDWYWWKEMNHREITISREKRVRSFNPIYRISSEAFKFLEKAFKSGWKGHNEVLLTTLLFHHGYQLLDFGGNGDFVSDRNKFYISRSSGQQGLSTGTMRYRPAMKTHGMRKNKLYHPVKEENGLGILRSNAGNFYRLIKIWFNNMRR
ncbi:hypothetical protein SAMN05443144_101107 [Fodinibius roseus]|uniref:DUF3405 domain-containing protein n=1 Tax=Fodinibius roseus TaxID=1194090 RepID=A0A1M4SS09_9BACT|nr:hypothetical protein [Fodinibius roseus]SHE34968.1 hypothetical protein SAMN05443144_101107 [Fodinibius roseus]